MKGIPTSKYRFIVWLLLGAMVAFCACNSGGHPRPSPTARPLPTPVDISDEPAAGPLLNPTFEALPGATATYGRLLNTTYQIEMPSQWNGSLVLYMHDTENGGPASNVYVIQPALRSYLIRNHYAWAASSYNHDRATSDAAADESAAVWDLFAKRFGRPAHTFALGEGVGGGAAMIEAERDFDRIDGALSLCGSAGKQQADKVIGDYDLAAAYIVGVTQAEWDLSTPAAIMRDRVLPAIDSSFEEQDQLLAILIRMTGGPRPLDTSAENDGFVDLIPLISLPIPTTYDNTATTYVLNNAQEPFGKGVGNVSSDAFNAGIIRYKGPDIGAVEPAQNLTGKFRVPVLMVTLTGDPSVPISEALSVRAAAKGAGSGNLLVQRAIQSARHCELTASEQQRQFEALVGWVEHGTKPVGEDFGAADLTQLGKAFTELPRLGAPEDVLGPNDKNRVRLSGNVTLDGKPFDAPFFRMIVEHNGLLADCRLTFEGMVGGFYHGVIATTGDQSGCGEAGAQMYIESQNPVSPDFDLFSLASIPWPTVTDKRVTFAAAFSSTDPKGVSQPFTQISGEALDARGHELGAGTRIDAYIGTTLCGTTSYPRVATLLTGHYTLLVVGPTSVPGCTADAPITFKVNGTPVQLTATNNLEGSAHGQTDLDLVLPAK